MIDPEQFQQRLREWYALQKERDPQLSLGKLERLTGVGKGFWSVWLSGNGDRKSQQAPSLKQWRDIERAFGDLWSSAFSDLWTFKPRLALANRFCPICGGPFRTKRNQIYDSRYCRFVALCRREDAKRREDAAAGQTEE